ncbi:nucleoside hydrolase [Acetobacteraceae bacterium KSS8]|uniref:Nucleoside hydrolase n=1 Tax=Endosaccharibacter trunci TaxID=2812733 RepID=A0ABT1W339_9PROT|nr:nucleoside hydrolase [Acetobacteraceae bacterium KSS8]
MMLIRSLVRCAALFLLCGLAPARAETLVFLDNDFSGPGETNIQSLIPALFDPNVKLLGVGVVTGDAWRDEGAAHLLAFLDQIGCGSLPVYPGAELPLRRRPNEIAPWQSEYGKLRWTGAFQPADARHPDQHPDRPSFVPPLVEGAPATKMRTESAAAAMIAAVHAHPHQVVIVAAGPMTDLALAIREDPHFAELAGELVFMGGLLDTDLPQIAVERSKAIDFFTDFNMSFDPEAAHVVLTAPWARIVNVGNVTLGVPLTGILLDKAPDTPQGRYFRRYAKAGIPMWDELTMAIAIHPDLVTASMDATLDVDTGGGLLYGRAHARVPALSPHGVPAVRIVTEVDKARFYAGFAADLARAPACRP